MAYFSGKQSVAAAGLMFFLLLLPYHTHAAVLYLSPISVSSYMEERVALDVWLKTEGRRVDGFEALLMYPDGAFTFDRVTSTSVFTLSSETAASDRDGFTSLLVRGTSISGVDQDTGVARIFFTARRAGMHDIFFGNQTRVLNNENAIPHQSMGSVVTIRTGQAPDFIQQQDSSVRDINRSLSSTGTIYSDTFIQNEIDEEKSELTAEFPRLYGKTSVPHAVLMITIDGGLVQEQVIADANGEWHWSLPTELLPSTYEVLVKAVHPDMADVFDLDVTLVKRVTYDVAATQYSIAIEGPRQVTVGATAAFTVSYLHFGSTQEEQIQTPLRVRYTLAHPDLPDFYDEEEDQTIVGTRTLIRKEIPIPFDAPTGKYTFMVTANLADHVIDQQYAVFFVNRSLRRSMTLIVISIGIIFFAFIARMRGLRKKRERKK